MKNLTKKTLIIILSVIIAACIAACVATAFITKAAVSKSGSNGNTMGDICIDGCDIPRYDENGNEVFAVVSPVGYCDVDMIKQAPRLDTLSGKKIALVGGSFMASTTHFEIKRCIEEEYENVTIYMFNQVGSAGNFAVPSKNTDGEEKDTLTQVKRFQNKLKDLKIDAVIGGNCGCGICTMKESGSAIAAEYIGIPAVMVAAPTFTEEVHSIGVSRGVPVLRTAEYPGAFASHTPEQLKENTRHVVWEQIKEALTKPITQAEIKLYENEGERPYDEIIYYGTNDEIQDYMKYNEWTDGLPVGLPTQAKVEEYLKFTPYKEDEILGGDDGMILMANRKNYVYTVAANAVMSGVPAEFMPLCIAFVECMDHGDWYRMLISSHGWSPYAWLNGPVARQLGIDCGQGAISEETNKALGRFIDLAMLNIGGYYIKENRAGTFGYLTPFTFAEDEEACFEAGWVPYHVANGYDMDRSTVTAGSALCWGNNVATSTSEAEEIMKTMAFDITEKQENGLGTIDPHVYRTVLITKDVALALSKKYTTKEELEDALIATARRPVMERAYALYYGNTGSQPSKNYTFEEYYEQVIKDLEALKTNTDPAKQFDADVRLTDVPEWLKATPNSAEQVLTFATMKKGETPLIITGDTSRNKFQVMPGGGYATVEIKLPDNWDELLAPLGYEPLKTFFLSDKYGTAEKKDIAVPDGLSDGTYLLFTRDKDVNADNKISFSYDTLYYFENDEKKSVQIDAKSALANLLKNLKAPCSIVVGNGIVTGVIIRPNTSDGVVSDLSALRYADYGTAEITFAVNLKQSSAAGRPTGNGTTVIISSTVENLSLDLGGAVIADSENDDNFITVGSDGKLTVNTEATGGLVCSFRADGGDGTYRTVKFTMKSDGLISIEYNKEAAQ
ncbi:MAG: hypothetical protein NC033_04845 [Clostridiales bacterium]|nr:hypothetical protein [Clostridiales bacterium]